MKLAATEYSN